MISVITLWAIVNSIYSNNDMTIEEIRQVLLIDIKIYPHFHRNCLIYD